MAGESKNDAQLDRESAVNEPPPVGRTWKNVYAFVLGALVVVIVLLFALTRAYS